MDRWNYEAFAAYALIALFVLFPILRGWGTVVVRIALPDKTKGYFSIHINRRSDQVAQKTVNKKTGKEKIRSHRRLDFLRRYETHMAGRQSVFRWIPARRTDYTITVGGPLLDATGKEIIGHFLEEQKIRVRRGATTNVDFDFRPRECAVEVSVHEDGRAVSNARVAVAGDPSSLRYAREGVAYLYLGRGEYTILVGSKDAAAEFRVRIDHLEAAIPLHVDLAETDVVFRGCPAAVEPYLVGDHASAAQALHAAGNVNAARRLRAGLLERSGRSGDAAAELEAVGDLTQAAELRASDARPLRARRRCTSSRATSPRPRRRTARRASGPRPHAATRRSTTTATRSSAGASSVTRRASSTCSRSSASTRTPRRSRVRWAMASARSAICS